MPTSITVHDVKEISVTDNEAHQDNGLVYGYIKVKLTDKNNDVTELTVFTTDKSVSLGRKGVITLAEETTYEDINVLEAEQERLENEQERLENEHAIITDRIDELESFPIKTKDEAIELYEEMINESTDIDSLPAFILKGTAAEAMKENDPTMYRCGFCDFLDGLNGADQVVPEHTEWSV